MPACPEAECRYECDLSRRLGVLRDLGVRTRGEGVGGRSSGLRIGPTAAR